MTTGTNYNAETEARRQETSLARIARSLRDFHKEVKAIEKAAGGSISDALNHHDRGLSVRALSLHEPVRDFLNSEMGKRYLRKLGGDAHTASNDILSGNVHRLAVDPKEAERIRQNILQNVGLLNGHQGAGGFWAGAGAGGLHGFQNGINQGQGFGGAIGQGLAQGAAGGIASRFGGGMGAQMGAVVAMQAIMAAWDTDAVQKRHEELDHFRHSMGLTAKAFDALNSQVTKNHTALGLNIEEYQRAFTAFGKASGIKDDSRLERGTSLAAGMAKMLGIDPNGAASQFGQMNYLSNGKTELDDRKRIITVMDTVTRSGQFQKGDEFLAAFTTQMDRMVTRSLVAPTEQALGEFGSLLASMAKTGGPGLTGSKGAAVFDQLNQGFARGGSNEAGEVFLYQMLAQANPSIAKGGLPGFNNFKVQLEKGLLGTGENGKTNLSTFMERLGVKDGMSDQNRAYFESLLQAQFSLSASHARGMTESLLKMGPSGMDNFSKFAQAAGFDPLTINDTAVAELMKLQSGITPDANGNYSLNAEQQKKAQEIAQNGAEKSQIEDYLKNLKTIDDNVHLIKEIMLEGKEAVLNSLTGELSLGQRWNNALEATSRFDQSLNPFMAFSSDDRHKDYVTTKTPSTIQIIETDQYGLPKIRLGRPMPFGSEQKAR
jgi:hypothetical protein